ncbi:MAG: hypothetical protein ACKVRP_14610 [Bacteroidota bacterium]
MRNEQLATSNERRMGSRKMKGFWGASLFGFAAFMILVIKMPPEHLMTLCQFYFAFQTVTTATFFGGNAVEHWTDKLKSEKKEAA